MALIELSAGLMAGLPLRILRTTEQVNTSNLKTTSGLLIRGTGGGYGSASGSFALMQGAVPADLSTLTAYNVRSADVLVNFSAVLNEFLPSQSTVNPAIISTVYVPALASGTATWFWWTVRPSYYLDSPNTIIHQIIGTVGLTGSGADLEMGTVALEAASLYRVLNLRILFPSTWTY